MSDENKSSLPQVITSEVAASEETVAAVRAEIPVGVAGAPIDRIPLQPQLAALANAGTYTKRIASTDRCIRVVDVPVKGGASIQVHCSRACVSVGDMRLCPDHDKAAFQPTQTAHGTVGRVLNSASIPLTKSEQDDLAKSSKSYAERGESALPPKRPLVEKFVGAPKTGDITGAEPPHDITVYLTLDELAGRELLAVLRDRICAALDNLPCGSVRQMKQIVAIQEKIAKLGGTPRRRERNGTSTPKTSE